MPKRLFLILLLIPLLLAACDGETQTPVVEGAAPVDTIPAPTDTVLVPTPIDTPEPTETVAGEEEVVEVDTAQVAVDLPTGECTLVSSMSDAPAQYLEFFSPTDADWVAGPETAGVTFVEYSDFQ